MLSIKEKCIRLYIVATPIGNIRDFSARGIETLSKVDIILCEDTRITYKLLKYIGVNKKLIIYNDHNAQNICPKIIKDMQENETVYAIVSDAGTPLISDPGFKLIRSCIKNNISFTSIPGACAVINALVLSGMPNDNFLFAGFSDNKKFQELSKLNTTIIFYESPHKIINTLELMKNYFSNRHIVVIREMTKIFEEVIRGSFDEIIYNLLYNTPKGEFVIILSPPNTKEDILQKYNQLINFMLTKFSINEVSKVISSHTGLAKNIIYNYIKSFCKND